MSATVAAPVYPSPSRSPGQLSFAELDQPLRETTFVVVDLETTGGSAAAEAITEIGAVKVRGGEVVGEFATLVDPGRSIPPQIIVLTGITDAMVRDAPRIQAVLPALLEFIAGSVLVAHNAGFDTGFLKAACAAHGFPWPAPVVIDTVRLARRALSRQEAPSVRLGALAPLLGATVTPDHRALSDARATVDVLHALLERLGSLGVQTLPDLQEACRDVAPARRRKRHLADGLPNAPGVYVFRGPNDEVLYVGTSGDIRRRVRSYFTAAETRNRVKEMVLLAERVEAIECAHALEAAVREQRLIAAHRPPYNRRSRSPNKVSYLVLTDETFPRLSIVRHPRPACLGPFASRLAAQAAADAITEVIGIRQCTTRIRRNAPDGSPCALAELQRCGAPCSGAEDQSHYARHTSAVAELAAGRSDQALAALRERMRTLAAAGRFDAAAAVRDRTEELVSALDTGQRLAALAAVGELVAARPDGAGGWELAVVRFGRLAAAGHARRGMDAVGLAALLRASAETVLPAAQMALPAASAEEGMTLLRWLEQPGTRLVTAQAPWCCPAAGAGRWRAFAAAARHAREGAGRARIGARPAGG